jgi:hypothetical protein
MDAVGGLEKIRLGSLNIRDDVLQGFATVRECHARLQATLHQVMRRVVLPQAREIGEELGRIKTLYDSGRKAPGGQSGRFYSDCESLTGLKKAQVANYIQLATNWHRLMDFMADLPEGAEPITSMRGAMEAIRTMNRPERPGLDGTDGAVDVSADDIDDIGKTESESTKARLRYTERPRELASSLQALKTIQAIPLELRERLEDYCAELGRLLDSIEMALVKEPLELKQPTTAEESLPEPSDCLEPEHASSRPTLKALYPLTAEGLAAIEGAIAVAGSGALLARQLGCTRQAVNSHRRSIRQSLDQAAMGSP